MAPRLLHPAGVGRTLGAMAIGLFSAFLASGCALSRTSGLEQRPDGSYKLTCRTALPQCLEKAEEVCKGTRYVVTRAADHHDYLGAESTIGETQVRTSEAVFVCGKRGRSLWGADADPMAVPTASAASTGAAAASSRACVPGATQPCTGAAACRGGQACLPDGSAFGRCDCGERSAPQVTATPEAAPPSASTAPTPTPAGIPTVPSSGPPLAPRPATSPDAHGATNAPR